MAKTTISQGFKLMNFIKKIITFSPRQYTGEIKTAEFLEKYLKERDIKFSVQRFKTTVPVEKKAILTADGKKVKCKSSCFVSGNITNKDNIISSLSTIDEKHTDHNINFNPYCSSISLAAFYTHPAVAIARGDVDKILKAKKIEGYVEVLPTSYIARNILVGNSKNPKLICFAHYDSLCDGAWDNACGVATIMANIILYPHTLQDTLYVFTANEEVSYDQKPAYRCRGFRCFEKKYIQLLKEAKKIIVVDGVGIGPSYRMTEYARLESTIFIKNLKKFISKIKRLGINTLDSAEHLYHSELDNITQIHEKYVIQTIETLHQEVIKK